VPDTFLRFLAAWALVHETADEGWKAAVARGVADGPGAMEGGPDAFVNGLSALVAEEKDRLKARLATGAAGAAGPEAGSGADSLAELRFEVAEIRARLESIEVALDTLLHRSDPSCKT
jgi:hypothetical protein